MTPCLTYKQGDGSLLKYSLCGMFLGFLLDLAIGDPKGWPHIVRGIGKLISFLEKHLYPMENKFRGGLVLVFLTSLLSSGIPLAVLLLSWHISGWLYLAADSLLVWQLLSVKSLADETRPVYDALASGNLPGARAAVSMVVGRDTQDLDESGTIRAAVETVAENTADGIAAPYFYILLGGPALGCFYKAANTMDSMIGYHSEKYELFGRAAARLDDVLGFLPSRICAVLMILASGLTGYDMKNAFRIWRRDASLPASPNAGQCESVMAGAFHIRLGGNAFYFGHLNRKPYLGNDDRPIEKDDILRSHRVMYATAFLLFFLAAAVKGGIILAVF